MTLGILEEKTITIFEGNSQEVEDEINEHFSKYHRARLIDIKYSTAWDSDAQKLIHSALVIFTETG